MKKSETARTASEIDDTASVVSSSSAAAASATSSNSSNSSKRQRTLVSMLKATPQECLIAIAQTFTAHSIAHANVESPEFRNLLRVLGYSGPLPSRQSLHGAVQQVANDTRAQVASLLRGAVITLAADGWTNVKRQKITNIVLMVNGVAYYWSSVVNTGENTAEWLASQLLPIIRALGDTYGARVIGVVVDNEAVNAAAHRLLLPDLPWLIHVPCAAHTIQLVVRSCLLKPEVVSTVAQFVELVRLFDAKQHRIALRKMQEAHEAKQLVVQKPCDTRWSSLLTSAERMLLLEKEVTHVCLDALPSITAAFWTKLRGLVAFLKPFQVATDRIQRDSATLYTVFEQFEVLREHAVAYPWARSCIDDRWEKRVHRDAVTASALLSFVQPNIGLSRQSAQTFLVTFGAAYIAHYQLVPKTEQEIGDALTMQLADFNGREGAFHKLNDRIETAKRAAAAVGATSWSPRKVWLLYSELELGIVAAALLSVSASEAAVERTFSAQGLVHSDRRNQLASASVEAEMMFKFNSRTLKKEQPLLSAGVIDMLEDASKQDEDAVTVVPESLQDGEEHAESMELLLDEEVIEHDEEEKQSAASAAAAQLTSAQRRALRRQPSITFRTMADFLEWFIQQQKLTAHSTITANVEAALVGLSDRLNNCPGAATLKLRLSEALAALSALPRVE
jgi:hypothetical protein